MRRVIVRAVCALIVGWAGTAVAQDPYPKRVVRIVVPATPGGPSDLVARVLADKLSALWGQGVVVENRPGGQQMIAATTVANAPADGHTLLQGTSNVATNPIFNRKMPYNVSDLVAVTRTHLTPMLLAVNNDVPARSLSELLQYLRRDGTSMNFGTTGAGSSQQLATWQLILAANLPRMNEIPYQGSSQAHPDLIAGRVALMIDPAAAIATHVRSGAVRGIAVAAPRRLQALPNVPTVEESGLKGVDLAGWGGLFAPAGTPPTVLDKLGSDLRRVLSAPDVQARFEEMGLVAAPTTPEEFQRFVAGENARWEKVVKDAGIPTQ